MAPATHEVQPLEVPSVHVAHDASQLVQVLFSSAYLLLGHDATHEPSSKYLVPLDGQVRHALEEAPLHVSQELWHEAHMPCPLTTSTKLPVLGHSATHVPLDR